VTHKPEIAFDLSEKAVSKPIGFDTASSEEFQPLVLDEYQSCSGEEMAIVYRHVETINDEARRDDDGAAIPCIVWKRAAVWRAVEPTTVARRV
jgi:hypothetical protein